MRELESIGLSAVTMDQKGYVLATLPANTKEKLSTIGLIAHMDTSSEASGANVKMLVHQAYSGGDLVLNEDKNILLSPVEFPELRDYIGQDIITSDGTTLLGADDKAGICAIVSACEELLNSEYKHGTIKIAFTPDEEVGRGADFFPVESFAADFAYTIDGGALGELNYETFNACGAKIVFHGRSVHPGAAKHKMLNAIGLAAEWQSLLPPGEKPEYTEGYEGFYHITRINGGTECVILDMILRDHDKAKLVERKNMISTLAEFMNKKYGSEVVSFELKDSYENMKEYILPVQEVVERAAQSITASGLVAKVLPIRGGTDGARLSALGLPCPNIFTGGHNFHGRYEYLPVASLMKCVEVIIKLVSK